METRSPPWGFLMVLGPRFSRPRRPHADLLPGLRLSNSKSASRAQLRVSGHQRVVTGDPGCQTAHLGSHSPQAVGLHLNLDLGLVQEAA